MATNLVRHWLHEKPCDKRNCCCPGHILVDHTATAIHPIIAIPIDLAPIIMMGTKAYDALSITKSDPS